MLPWPLKPPSQGLRGLGWRGLRVQVPRVSSCRSTFAFLVRRPRGSNLMQPQSWILTQAPSYTLSQRVGDSSKEMQTKGPILKLGDVRPGAPGSVWSPMVSGCKLRALRLGGNRPQLSEKAPRSLPPRPRPVSVQRGAWKMDETVCSPLRLAATHSPRAPDRLTKAGQMAGQVHTSWCGHCQPCSPSCWEAQL